MKNSKKLLVCLLVGVLLISSTFVGCKNENNNEQKGNVPATSQNGESGDFENKEADDIKNSESGDSNNEEYDDSQNDEPDNSQNDEYDDYYDIMVSVKDEKSEYEYNGDDVVIEYQYGAKNMPSVGIMILCDGIVTPFHTNENEENAILQRVKLEDSVIKDIDLYFTPYGQTGETVNVQIIDIVDPDYDVTEEEQETIITDFANDLKYTVNYISGIHVAMNTDGISYEKKFCSDYSQAVIPEEDKEDNPTFDADNLQSLISTGTVNGEKSLWYTVEQGEQLNLETIYFGSAPGNIITSIYVDGELYPAFNGCEYVECPVDDIHYTVIKGTIDTSGLEKGRHIIYGACGYVDFNSADPILSSVIEVK